MQTVERRQSKRGRFDKITCKSVRSGLGRILSGIPDAHLQRLFVLHDRRSAACHVVACVSLAA